ncbi:hypothetical protein [Streptomyces sp. NPDC051636]
MGHRQVRLGIHDPVRSQVRHRAVQDEQVRHLARLDGPFRSTTTS